MAGLEFAARSETANIACAGDYPRESSESPMLNAFCRVAISVLFNLLAILAAGVFLRARDLSSRTCTDVQARLLAFLAMYDLQF